MQARVPAAFTTRYTKRRTSFSRESFSRLPAVAAAAAAAAVAVDAAVLLKIWMMVISQMGMM